MNLDSITKPLTKEELLELANLISQLENEKAHVSYLQQVYESTQQELAWEVNRVVDLEREVSALLAEEVE